MKNYEHVKDVTLISGDDHYFLDVYDTNVRDSEGRWVLAYELKLNGKLIFDGEDFHCVRTECVDSDAVCASILHFLALKPGDTDEEYFKDYTPEQLEWVSDHGDTLFEWAEELENPDEETKRRKALAAHLCVDVDEIKVARYNEKTFILHEHKVKRGTSPDEAKRLVQLLRQALQHAVDHARTTANTEVVRDVGSFGILPPTSMSTNVDEWRTSDLKMAHAYAKYEKDLLGDRFVLATYKNLCDLMDASVEAAKLLKEGVHDAINTLYFLTPQSDGSSAKDHIATLVEAFDEVPITDRRTTETVNDGEYLVVTDEEADELWDQSLESYLEDCVEGADSPYFDRDRWKKDARSDGRGHSLAGYDGSEQEEGDYYIYRIG